MSKPITYTETLARRDEPYLIVSDHSAYFCFDTNQFTPVRAHHEFIKGPMLAFVKRAIRRLGPDRYELTLQGSASATGPSELNFELASKRMSGIMNAVLAAFEAEKKKDPTLTGYSLSPAYVNHGDEEANKDPLLPGTRQKGGKAIEKAQRAYRSAVFNFTAGQRNKSSTFRIREIYNFKFKEIETDLPGVLNYANGLLKFFKNPAAKAALDKTIDALQKAGIVPGIGKALGAPGFAAKHVFNLMIPKAADYCFEIKDSLDDHALYRFNGMENSDSVGVMDLIGLAVSLSVAVKRLEKIGKQVESLMKGYKEFKRVVEFLQGLAEIAISEATIIIRQNFGPSVADEFTAFVRAVREQGLSLADNFVAPASDWQPFRFFDGGSDYDVKQLEGTARVERLSAHWHSITDVSFGGSANPRSTQWKANALLKDSSFVRGSLFRVARGDGLFIPLRLGYTADIKPGFASPVID